MLQCNIRGAAAPVSLPVQALYHATGYLMAAAAVRGVISRLSGNGSAGARLSLARTAKLLIDNKHEPTDAPMAELTDGDFSPAIELTDWGPAQRLLSPIHVAGAPMYWTRPATRLGSHEPSWT